MLIEYYLKKNIMSGLDILILQLWLIDSFTTSTRHYWQYIIKYNFLLYEIDVIIM